MKDTCPNCGKKVDRDFKFCPFCFQDFQVEDAGDAEIREPEQKSREENSNSGESSAQLTGSEVESTKRESDTKGEKELIIGGKYRITEPLHSSPFGTVCKAEYKDDPEHFIVLRDFLLRERDPKKKQELIQQCNNFAGVLNSLSHNNLASIHEFIAEDNYLYLVFDYIEGKFIDKVLLDYQIKRGGNLPGEKIIFWSYQLCELLLYIHGRLSGPGCCVNLRPYSLMIDSSDTNIIFIHLGLVEFCHMLGVLESYESQLTSVPRDNYPIYEMYSLGGVMYYLATGINIFQGESYQPIENKRKDLSPELIQIIIRLLTMPHKPTFSEIGEVKEEIKKLLPQQPEEFLAAAAKEESETLLWQEYLGNKGRTNSFGAGPSPPLDIKWKTAVHKGLQNFLVPHASVLISLSDKGNLTTIDYVTGDVRKKECYNINPVAPIVIDDQLCICSSSTQLSVNVKDLSKQWDFRTKSMVLCSPSFIQGKLCYVAYDGILIFVDHRDGKALSMENLGAKIIATPAFDDLRLYIPTLSGSIVAISLSERTVLWQQNTKSAISSAPAILRDRIFFGNNKGKIFSLCRITGEVKWELPLKGAISQSVRALDDKIFVFSSAGDFLAIDAESGTKIWNLDLKPHKEYFYTVSKKVVYLIDDGNCLLLIDSSTGETLYRHDIAAKPNGIPLLYNDALYLTLATGEILALCEKGRK